MSYTDVYFQSLAEANAAKSRRNETRFVLVTAVGSNAIPAEFGESDNWGQYFPNVHDRMKVQRFLDDADAAYTVIAGKTLIRLPV